MAEEDTAVNPADSDPPTTPPQAIEPPALPLRTATVVRWGMLGWLLALVMVLLVPDLRAGDRAWWPWVPVSALGLGLIGLTYLNRGRGNASDA